MRRVTATVVSKGNPRARGRTSGKMYDKKDRRERHEEKLTAVIMWSPSFTVNSIMGMDEHY